MTIREILEHDRSSLVDLVSMMIGDSSKEEVANEIVNDFYSNKHFSTFVLEINGQIECYAAYKREPFEGSNQIGEIVFLGTKQSARKRGYGRLVVEHTEKFAREEGIRKLYVKTNPFNKKAVCFWIKNDYQFEARFKDFNCENHDAYFMGKAL